MKNPSKKSRQRISEASEPSTPSPVLVDGRLPLTLPDGIQRDLFGVAVVPAPRSRRRGRKSLARNVAATLSLALSALDISSVSTADTHGSPTAGTCGPSSGGSSATAALQRALESKLVVMMEEFGSPEFALRWKRWAMPLGVPILQRGASHRRISVSGCTGWPTPQQRDGKGEFKNHTKQGRDLSNDAKLIGWNTPRATDGSKGGPNQTGGALPADAALAGWPSPMAGSPATEDYNEAGNTDSSRKTVELLAGWATPKSTEHQTTGKRGNPTLNGMALGLTTTSSLAKTQAVPDSAESPVSLKLNAEFSFWLMGFPPEWIAACRRAMASRSRRRSRGVRPS